MAISDFMLCERTLTEHEGSEHPRFCEVRGRPPRDPKANYRHFMPRPATPFLPKTNTHLLPGDFWALPLSDGRFGAGRVLARQGFEDKDRTGCMIALLDWVGTKPPTGEDLAGAQVVAWALAHVDAIAKTGGEVLGNRPLTLDGIQAPELVHAVGEKSSVWGWRTILNRAEARFLV